jgi:hypothetical protein
MPYLSDKVLRYTIWVLYTLAVVVFVVAIFLPVKTLVEPKVITRPDPAVLHSDPKQKQNFNKLVIGEV